MSNPLSSSPTLAPRPGLLRGAYPQQERGDRGLWRQWWHDLGGRLGPTAVTRDRQWREVRLALAREGEALEALSTEELEQHLATLRGRLQRQGLIEPLIIVAFALIREMAGRVLGMRHYDNQLRGGWGMIKGRVVEMETGEGKTFMATLAAATAGLAAVPVHVITVNDYLVERDARLMSPLYQALGLSVGVVTARMPEEERRQAYGSHVTYATNKQLAFDYLRDRLQGRQEQGPLRQALAPLLSGLRAQRPPMLRGLCFAIIDEADSVLIDEARTPLILSQELVCKEENKLYRTAMFFAGRLQQGCHYRLQVGSRQVELSREGEELLAQQASSSGGVWGAPRRRRELVCQALAAREFYHRDQHYLVADGKIIIIDQNTGRPMADRSWQRGLQQMIEIKENCQPTSPRETLARLTYQRFFRRYLRLAGMSGTLHEVRQELWSVYDLRVEAVECHRPGQRHFAGRYIWKTRQEKWQEIIRQAQDINAMGRPLLIGTRTVADSEQISALLNKEGLTHQLLNARQDAGEAAIIAQAGQGGQITVATNMAGRGTDIPLGPGVAALGGLHVIVTQGNEASRLDRQLIGRCARQGDPGSYAYILSLEDGLFDLVDNCLLVRLGRFVARQPLLPFQRLGHFLFWASQHWQQQYYKRLRRELIQHDRDLGRQLAFSGGLE